MNDLLSHELHHYLKDKNVKIKRPKQGDPDIKRALFALENEGIADMCSFQGISFIYEKLGFAQKGIIERYLNNSIDYLISFGEMLEKKIVFNFSELSVYDYIMEEQKVHPLGYAMACQIKETFGSEDVKKCVGDPFQFILKYHTAVMRGYNKRILSNEVIKYLRELYRNN